MFMSVFHAILNVSHVFRGRMFVPSVPECVHCVSECVHCVSESVPCISDCVPSFLLSVQPGNTRCCTLTNIYLLSFNS